LLNPFYFASLIQNTIGKAITARYPFILIYAFAIVLVKLMPKKQTKMQISTCQIWIIVFPPSLDKYMTWENLHSNYSTQLPRHFTKEP